MKNRGTFLFIFFLLLALIFLVGINFLRYSIYLVILGEPAVLAISVILIIFIILLFIYREIENNKIISQFITIVTHKIKTPLTGIRWTIDMLQKDLTLLEKKDLLVEMQKANERLMEITDLLVGFAKFDKRVDYVFESVSVRELVNNSLNKNMVSVKAKNIQFTVGLDGDAFPVMVDKQKIQFAIDMIVDNALKYTPKGGAIHVSFATDSKYVTIKVADNGIGMSYFDKQRVFSHFFRANNARAVDSGGLGLGLYASKKIVVQNKGKLWAESAGVNKGSSFYIRLPIKR
jgi:signal transduction histidine kinase